MTEGEIKKQWRKDAMEHHPDRGGDPEVFANLRKEYVKNLNRARVAKKRTIKSEIKGQTCTACKGLGSLKKSLGFSSINIMCPRCRGCGLELPKG